MSADGAPAEADGGGASSSDGAEVRFYQLGRRPLEEALGLMLERVLDRGQRALTCATFKRDVASMRHLLAAGADPDAGTPSARQTAQMFAGDDLLAVLDGGDAAPSSPEA